MSSVFACHPGHGEGSAWPDAGLLTASGMTHAWSTQSEQLTVLARPPDVGHAAPAQLRMRGMAADVGAMVPAAHTLGLFRWRRDHGALARVVVGPQRHAAAAQPEAPFVPQRGPPAARTGKPR